MTITVSNPELFQGNGVQTDFPVSAMFYNVEHVRVQRFDGAFWQNVLTSEFSVLLGTGKRPGTGTIRFVTPPEDGATGATGLTGCKISVVILFRILAKGRRPASGGSGHKIQLVGGVMFDDECPVLRAVPSARDLPIG